MSNQTDSPNERVNQALLHKRPGTLLVGGMLSLLLHAGLLYLYRTAAPPRADSAPGAPYTMVWMVPLKPHAAPTPAAALPERGAAISAPPRTVPARRVPKRPADTTVASAASQPITTTATPQPAAASTLAAEAEAAPRFDVNLALASARKFAGERARKSDPAVAQLQDKPINELRSESQLAGNIQKASRGDCKTMASGLGVLALVVVPLVLLTDKKDSGCKW